MAAIIELNDQQRADLVKMLNNLNLGFVYSGFGEAFVGMVTGEPVTMEPKEKDELKHLINHLNLGTWHGKTGDLLVDLMGAQSGPGTAQAMTEKQVEMVAEHLQHLNKGLAKLGIGQMVKATVAAYQASAGASTGSNPGSGTGGGNTTPAPATLAWAKHPTTGTIGTDVVFSWAGGSNGAKDNYKVTVTMPDDTQHDSKSDPAKTYTLATTNEAAGKWKVKVESLDGQTIEQEVTMAAAPASSTPPASTGTPPA
ncbi:hypothetical protein ACVOZ6_003508 [Escherichia coli]